MTIKTMASTPEDLDRAEEAEAATNPIYYHEAAEKLTTSAWQRDCDAFKNYNAESTRERLLDCEQAWKQETGQTQLPATWRVNKSLILRAKYLGLPLLTASGKAVARTWLEREIKRLSRPQPSMFDAPDDTAPGGTAPDTTDIRCTCPHCGRTFAI